MAKELKLTNNDRLELTAAPMANHEDMILVSSKLKKIGTYECVLLTLEDIEKLYNTYCKKQ